MEFYELLLLSAALIQSSWTEWIAQPIGIPKIYKPTPREFSVNLAWTDDSGVTRNIHLNLKKNTVHSPRVPLFEKDRDSDKAIQPALLNLKHTTFYQDEEALGSISLTKFSSDKVYKMKGSFVSNNDLFNIDPYHSAIHKRSIQARQGVDHIITQVKDARKPQHTDYIYPAEGTLDYDIMNKADQLRMKWKDEGSHEWANHRETQHRDKRQTLPDTTYTVEIYMIVDYYLYVRLADMATTLAWSEGTDDFIAFMMGHMANEIDVRYRNIDNAAFTMSTKLSYLHVAKTENDSVWTAPDADTVNLQLNSSVGLGNLDLWVQNGSANVNADHYMLVTWLDLWYGVTGEGFRDTANAGLANVGGACLTHPTSINEFPGTTVLAHELGHNLGASHDGDQNPVVCAAGDQFVMAPSSGLTSVSTRANNWKFSSCSIDYFEAFIATLNDTSSNCLLNQGSYISSWADDYNGTLGQVVSPDEQCQLIFQDTNRVYRGGNSTFDVCNSLWCYDTSTGSTNAKSGAFEYTTCGDGQPVRYAVTGCTS